MMADALWIPGIFPSSRAQRGSRGSFFMKPDSFSSESVVMFIIEEKSKWAT